MIQQPPTSTEAQLAWLVDRAQIADVIVEHARCLDDKDWAGLQALFAQDGYFEVPFARVGKADIAARAEEHLGRYHVTHHLSANYAITIDGDEAHVRSYISATHVPSADDVSVHGDVGGWDETNLRREGGVWKITSRKANFLFRAGNNIPGE